MDFFYNSVDGSTVQISNRVIMMIDAIQFNDSSPRVPGRRRAARRGRWKEIRFFTSAPQAIIPNSFIPSSPAKWPIIMQCLARLPAQPSTSDLSSIIFFSRPNLFPDAPLAGL
jgi:hypothetical protein